MFPILDCALCLISRFSKFDPKLDTSVVLCAAAVGDWLLLAATCGVEHNFVTMKYSLRCCAQLSHVTRDATRRHFSCSVNIVNTLQMWLVTI